MLQIKIKGKKIGLRWFTGLSQVHRAQSRLEIKLNCFPGQMPGDFIVKQSHCTHLSISLHQNKTVFIRKQGKLHAKFLLQVYLSFI